jgi:translation elongation factor P/translation initiation factor 5A
MSNTNTNPIKKGSVVRYKDGHCRVTAIFKSSQTANLGGIFNGVVYHKRVPLSEMVEDEANWYKSWEQSETYQSM